MENNHVFLIILLVITGRVQGIVSRSLLLSPSGTVRVKDRSTLTLNCSTSSNNGTTNIDNIKWYKIDDNDQSLLLQPSGQRRAITDGDKLIVQLYWTQINITDNGQYRCRWSQFNQVNDVMVSVEGTSTNILIYKYYPINIHFTPL